METTLKEFVCTTSTQETETIYNFKAIIKCSDDRPYRLKVFTNQYKDGKTTSRAESELYFDKKEDLIKEFEYHYFMCSKNLFTKFIKIIK